MLNQEALWQRVTAIKRQVIEATGSKLSHEFRSTQVYQIYTGLCGECQMAYEDQELDENYVARLEHYAHRVIDLYQKGIVENG